MANMKIMFLNVCEAVLKQSLEDFIDKQKDTVDIFCFQETNDTFQKNNQSRLTEFNNISSQKESGVQDNYYLSSYVRKELEVLEEKTLFVDDLKIGLAQILKIRTEKKIFYLANIHGVWRPPMNKQDTSDRVRQSKAIVDELSHLNGAKIVGGDFNLYPETESILMFEKNGYTNLIKKFGIKTTRNEYAWRNYQNNKHYFSDYVFVSLEVKVKSFEVIENEVSDHLPMILEIEE